MAKRKRPNFYAVAVGRTIGVFKTWPETEKSVKGYPGAKHKSFDTSEQAEAYIENNRRPVPSVNSTSSSSVPFPTANHASNSSLIPTASSSIISSPVARVNTVHVYTDGACRGNGKRHAKAGIGVYWGPNDPRNVSAPLPRSLEQTNNRAEIHAAIRAIRDAKRYGYPSVTIHTDSELMINCITKWMKKWLRNGWKTVDGLPVINKQDLLELLDVTQGIEVDWVKVRGHSGDPGNDQADRLATKGIYQLSTHYVI